MHNKDFHKDILMTGTFSIGCVTPASQRSPPDGSDALDVCACVVHTYVLQVIGVDTNEEDCLEQ